MGLFRRIRKVGTSRYRFDFPASITIYNTFHISLLEPYEEYQFLSEIQTPSLRIEMDGEVEYKLEESIDSRLHRDKLQYRANQTGNSPEHHQTWNPAENCQTASIAIVQFNPPYHPQPRLDTCNHKQVDLQTSPYPRTKSSNTAARYCPRRMERRQGSSSQNYPHSPYRLWASGEEGAMKGEESVATSRAVLDSMLGRQVPCAPRAKAKSEEVPKKVK